MAISGMSGFMRSIAQLSSTSVQAAVSRPITWLGKLINLLPAAGPQAAKSLLAQNSPIRQSEGAQRTCRLLNQVAGKNQPGQTRSSPASWEKVTTPLDGQALNRLLDSLKNPG
jgi:hypothetical protein